MQGREPSPASRSKRGGMQRVLIVRVTVILAVLGACTSSAREGGEAPGRDPVHEGRLIRQEVRVTRDARRGPQPCRPGNVAQQVVDFFSAVNRGASSRITEFFTPQLGWYSVTEGNPRAGGRHFVAREPAELRTYFRGRIREHELLHLIEIDVDYERAGNLGHVAYSLRRTADDLAGYALEAGGKGAIDCDSGGIAVWSMAQGREPLPFGGLCPGEPEPPHVAIACARA
jgi:hypothetical protein